MENLQLPNGMSLSLQESYFIESLLKPTTENLSTSKFSNREAISRFRGVGGVRFGGSGLNKLLWGSLFALNPRLVDAQSNLGNLMKAQGLVHDACNCYMEALRIQPNFAIA